MHAANKKQIKREKPKYGMGSNSLYMIKRAWRERKSVIWLCFAQVFLAVVTSLLGLFIAPTILGQVENASPLSELLLTIFAFACGLMLVQGASIYLSVNIAPGRHLIRSGIAMDIQDKYSKTSYPNTMDPDINRRFDQTQYSVKYGQSATEAIWNTFSSLLTNGIGFVIYLILLSSLDPILLAVVLVTTITGYFINKHISEWNYRHRDEEGDYVHQMRYINSVSEDFSFGKDIRLFGMEGWLLELHKNALNFLQSFYRRGGTVNYGGDAVRVLFSFLRNGIAYYYLISMTIHGNLSASEFLLFFTAVGGFTSWINGILSGFSSLYIKSMEISTIREFLDTPEPFRFEEGKPLKVRKFSECTIELRNVSFRYPGAQKDTLHNINLVIHSGEKLAIVGLNGAGKTTIVKLICGFFDPTEGQVLFNGEDIRQYNRRDYYHMFAAVFQQFSLLAATIDENVAQKSQADEDKVSQCLEKAGLTHKMQELPYKTHTHLGKEVFNDAVGLSGGELQRLMLARALYKDAPFILLDEPTAALDPIAENDIYQRFNDLTREKTSVYISHRLASTRFCDRILLLADGQITEEGTHNFLLNQNGRYAELFKIQSLYYQEHGGEKLATEI
ncbi:MAG: ABC transporter ATP-binding protein [Oscillospiraceae bacterium]|nr:ABC transporter ATP-binding protein [Oscillospiraceae bacterium]